MSEKSTLLEVEKKYRDDVDLIEEFIPGDLSDEVSNVDKRSYVEKIFLNFIPGDENKPKMVLSLDCQGGPPPRSLKNDCIYILMNYKTRKVQGKRDPIAGNHVLALPLGQKEHFKMPLQDAKDFGLYMLRLFDAVEDLFADKDLDLEI